MGRPPILLTTILLLGFVGVVGYNIVSPIFEPKPEVLDRIPREFLGKWERRFDNKDYRYGKEAETVAVITESAFSCLLKEDGVEMRPVVEVHRDNNGDAILSVGPSRGDRKWSSRYRLSITDYGLLSIEEIYAYPYADDVTFGEQEIYAPVEAD